MVFCITNCFFILNGEQVYYGYFICWFLAWFTYWYWGFI